MAKNLSKKLRTLRKSLKNRYATVNEVNNRISDLIDQDDKRKLSSNEELELIELKRLRSQLDSDYKFLG